MDCGVLIILTLVYVQSTETLKKPTLTRFLQEDFIERLEESDINYHFTNKEKHFESVNHLL